MRHDEAGQSFWMAVQFTAEVLRDPTISTPYSSTHQHSAGEPVVVLLEHWMGSNSPIRLHFGTRTRCWSPAEGSAAVRALARLDSTRRRCWQAVSSRSGFENKK